MAHHALPSPGPSSLCHPLSSHRGPHPSAGAAGGCAACKLHSQGWASACARGMHRAMQGRTVPIRSVVTGGQTWLQNQQQEPPLEEGWLSLKVKSCLHGEPWLLPVGLSMGMCMFCGAGASGNKEEPGCRAPLREEQKVAHYSFWSSLAPPPPGTPGAEMFLSTDRAEVIGKSKDGSSVLLCCLNLSLQYQS